MRSLSIRAVLLMFFLCTGIGRGAEKSTSSLSEQLQSAMQVHAIFEAKCLDCHGPTLPRPKGKFGYVLDLKRIVANPDYVIGGKPEKSELFKLIRDDDMPGEDAKVPPLTKEEKEVVKHWITIGAPGELPPEMTKTAPVEAVKAPQSFWKKLLQWIGRFHPVSTHFPVALMYVAVMAEILAWATRRESWMQTVRFLIILAALSAFGSASLGWLNAWFGSYVGQSASILLWHRWLGTGTAFWAVLCASLALLHECPEGSKERQRFRGALLFGSLLVGVTGFLGSALIYGLDHYNW